jgi:hypothetical protein
MVGFIAEQVDEIGLAEFVVYDENNEPFSVSYNKMITLAVNAIKELKQEIEELQVFKIQYENLIARIEDLENK